MIDEDKLYNIITNNWTKSKRIVLDNLSRDECFEILDELCDLEYCIDVVNGAGYFVGGDSVH